MLHTPAAALHSHSQVWADPARAVQSVVYSLEGLLLPSDLSTS